MTGLRGGGQATSLSSCGVALASSLCAQAQGWVDTCVCRHCSLTWHTVCISSNLMQVCLLPLGEPWRHFSAPRQRPAPMLSAYMAGLGPAVCVTRASPESPTPLFLRGSLRGALRCCDGLSHPGSPDVPSHLCRLSPNPASRPGSQRATPRRRRRSCVSTRPSWRSPAWTGSPGRRRPVNW